MDFLSDLGISFGSWGIFLVVLRLIFLFIGVSMAKKRNRSKAAGGYIGFILGLLGLAFIAILGEYQEFNDYSNEHDFPTIEE